jgi:hypothetical protein
VKASQVRGDTRSRMRNIPVTLGDAGRRRPANGPPETGLG